MKACLAVFRFGWSCLVPYQADSVLLSEPAVPMGTRFKIRVCTWNVGNAAPPLDLRAWLGTDTEKYDIIVVGAQEAYFSTEKIHNSSNASSPVSEVNLSPSNNENSQPFSKSSPDLRPLERSSSPAFASTAGTFRRFSRVVRGAASMLRSGGKHERRRGDGNFKPNANEDSTRKSLPNLDQELLETDCLGNPLSPLAKPCLSMPIPDTQGELDDDVYINLAPRSYGVPKAATSPRFVVSLPSSEFFKNVDFEDIDSPGKKESAQEFPTNHVVPIEENETFETANVQASEKTVATTAQTDNEHLLRRVLTGNRLKEKENSNKQRQPFLGSQGDRTKEEGVQQSPSRNGRHTKFSQLVEKNIPECYHNIAKYRLLEIKLLVFVHKRHISRVVRTECVAEATGIGNVVGNKGGVALKLTLDDTSFCFVSCHLAAHEGAKFLQQRNDDVVEIMRNIDRNKVHGLPVMHRYDHLFWLGDLNYRLDLKRVLPAAVKWSDHERWCHVVDLITNNKYEQLAKLDELVHEMALKRVFAGFVEGAITFPPTFKVVRGRPYATYQALRVPSYCDRILWHSLPLHRNHVKLREYNSVASIDTSDHKPVYASFDVVIPKPIRIYSLPAPRDSLKCTIDFKRLRLHGLYEKRAECDENGLKYEVLEDGALGAVHEESGNATTEADNTSASHTRRVVHADFYGGGIFVKERPYRAEVPLKEGRIRECGYQELPKIALRPVATLADLTYKYVTIVFTRLGSRQGSSCVLSLASLVQGRNGMKKTLELTKYGECLAHVDVEAELVVSMETWIDGQNRAVKARR